jgi:hypothetical protein
MVMYDPLSRAVWAAKPVGALVWRLLVIAAIVAAVASQFAGL